MLKAKNLLPSFFLLWFCLTGFGQRIEILNTYNQNLTAIIDLANGQLNSFKSTGATQIRNTNVFIQNGELIIEFTLPKTNDEKEQYYLPTISVSLNGDPVTPYLEDLKGDVNKKIVSGGESDIKQIIWTDLLENNINLKGYLEIYLETPLWGKRLLHLPYNVDCDNPPQFAGKQKLPYYIAAGVGVAAIGVGQYFRIQSKEDYESYENGAKDLSLSLAEARPLYNSANDANQAFIITTLSGVAILTADVILFFVRKGRHKKQVQTYEDYCIGGVSLTFRPVFELPMPSGNTFLPSGGMAGIQLTCRF